MPEKRARVRVVCPEDADHFEFSKRYRGPPNGTLFAEFQGGEPPERCPVCGEELTRTGCETIA